MDRFNEGTTVRVVVSFFDETGAAVTPTSARYRIDDLGTATAILVPTDLTSLGTTKTIYITSAQNAMTTNSTKATQTRVLTVDFIYGSPAKHGVVEYQYALVNLRFAPVG